MGLSPSPLLLGKKNTERVVRKIERQTQKKRCLRQKKGGGSGCKPEVEEVSRLHFGSSSPNPLAHSLNLHLRESVCVCV